MKMKELIGKLTDTTKEKSPAILTGLAVVGLVSTGILAYKAGIKAKDIIEAKKKDLADVKRGDKEAKRTVIVEAAKELTPIILPPVLTGITSAACIIGSNTISTKRIAVLSAAYSFSEKAVKDLNEKMVEQLGAKKAKTIKDEVAKKVLGENQEELKKGNVIITGNGDVLCLDTYSGRYFRSNGQKIQQAINNVSADVLSQMYVSLNDFYDYIGLERLTPLGEDMGWSTSDLTNGTVPIDMSAILTEDENVPCLVISYTISPREDYRKLY